VTQLTADQYRKRLDKLAAHPAMSHDNIHADGAALSRAAQVLWIIGAVGLTLTLLGAFIVNGRHAASSFAVGVYSVTAISLGAMFWVMIFHLVRSQWSVTIRRQFENVMMNLPVCIGLLFVILVLEIAFGGLTLRWIGISAGENYLLDHKSVWLNEPFQVVRFAAYAGIWLLIATKLWNASVEQDETGDRFLTNKARFTSTWGMLLFALSVAFFAFDFLMAVDFRMFSTMWGVYYFTSCVFGSLSAVILILLVCKGFGRLTGAVTSEHTHDLGKLLFAFGAAFWAYIAFSQYFLIWYSNIPEETAFFVHRKENGWEVLSAIIVIGHFFVPFLILLQRPVKRSLFGLGLAGVWMLAMLVLDITWIIRPMVYVLEDASLNPGPQGWWVDVVAIVGVFCIWAGFLVRRIGRGPLIPTRDPRLPAALKHKNYV